MPSRILLTGCSGFVGSHLADKECVYRRVVRSKTRGKSDFFVDSIDADTDWTGAFDNIDCVIHLAGLAHSAEYSEEDFKRVNTLGTINLARSAAMSGVKRFVFVSTVGVLGGATSGAKFSSVSLPNPQSPYALSKYIAEQSLKKLASELPLEVVIVRPPLVYGDQAPGNFGRLVSAIRRLNYLPFGLARNKRSFISVNNLVDFLLLCSCHSKAVGKCFLVSDGEIQSTRSFCDDIAKGLGKSLVQLPVPVLILRFFLRLIGRRHLAVQLFDDLVLDISDSCQALNWTPPYKQIEEMKKLSK